MILNYSKFIGLPIADLKDQCKVGEIADLIFEPNCSVAAFVLKGRLSFWPDKIKIIPVGSTISVIKDGVVINDESCITDMDEMVRLKECVRKKLYGIGQKVETRSGKTIGRVYDYLFNSETLAITKFYIHSILQEKIISTSKIISIETGKIIVKDEFESIGLKNVVTESVIAN